MSNDVKPHVLHVLLNVDSVDFKIDCPHEDLGENRPCALFEECGDKTHQAPKHPEVPEPSLRTDDEGHPVWTSDANGHAIYVDDADPEAVRLWHEYEDAQAKYAETHPSGWHRTGQCWVQEEITCNSALGDMWEMPGFEDFPVTGPILVDWINRGSLDDSFLELSPWIEEGREV